MAVLRSGATVSYPVIGMSVGPLIYMSITEKSYPMTTHERSERGSFRTLVLV